MTARTIKFFFFFRHFLGPRKGAKYGHFWADRFFFGLSCMMHAGGCMQKNKEKRRSTQKTPKVSKQKSPAASNTVNGPCNYKNLYLWHRGRTGIPVWGITRTLSLETIIFRVFALLMLWKLRMLGTLYCWSHTGIWTSVSTYNGAVCLLKRTYRYSHEARTNVFSVDQYHTTYFRQGWSPACAQTSRSLAAPLRHRRPLLTLSCAL